MASAATPWPPLELPLLLLLLLIVSSAAVAAVPSDSDILLNFKASLSPSVSGLDAALRSWVPSSPPCRSRRSHWTGVICNPDGTVRGVQLENMSLAGELNTDALAVLPTLRTMSFQNNSFHGRIPDLAKFHALKSIYLSMNRFSGEVPDGIFAGMQWLKKVHLSRNDFSGRIPSSLLKVPRLLELRLDDNDFEGTIPDFRQPGLFLFNVSYNNLRGSIPPRLRKMNADWFAGNDDLCGGPLAVSCKSPPPSLPPSPRPRKFPPALIAAIILFVIALILFIISLILLIFCRRRRCRAAEPGKISDEAERIELNPSARVGSSKKDQGKLIFLKDAPIKFDLQDLLRASAEILGSADFGSSYKANLPVGPAVVVKRFKAMNGVGREDFHEHMRRIGRLCHPNLLPLTAYYYKKEEKLLVTEFIFNGSLAHMLHGSHGPTDPPLDWPTRLKIVKGVARGLVYLYEELSVLAAPHGHLKSSNVLLNYSFDPILCDYALLPVMSRSHASRVMMAFKSPECAAANGEPSRKSDVWSLGILILEILTGRFPAVCTDLASWASSMVAENRETEVFDDNMKGTQGGEAEMLKLLRIGLACSEAAVEKRCELSVAVAEIEELREYEDGHTLVLSANVD